MRLVDMKTGIKERLGDILGHSFGGAPSGNDWSIQHAMLDNIRRVVKGIVGDSPTGRVLSGMMVEQSGANKIVVSGGIAFTGSGNVINIGASLKKSITGNGTRRVYVNHTRSVLAAGSSPYGGRKVSLVNKPGLFEIVTDDTATTKGGNVQESVDEVLTVTDGFATNPENSVEIATIELTNGAITSIKQSYFRGFGPPPGKYQDVIYGISSQEASEFHKKTFFYDEVEFKRFGLLTIDSETHIGSNATIRVHESGIPKRAITATIAYIEAGTESTKYLKFINGILVE